MTKKTVKRHLHTTISPEVYETIEQLAHDYGTKQNVIESAITLLQVRHHMVDQLNKQELDPYQLWHLMKSDFNMMAVARRTFLSYIKQIPEEPIQNNNALELIEWYYDNTPIKDLNLYQILEGIRNLWIAGNYFRKIDIQIMEGKDKLQATTFKMIFSHDFDAEQYGKYWAQYFKYVLELPSVGSKVEYSTRNQSFYMEIQKKRTI